MSDMLKLRASYKESIHQLQSALPHPEEKLGGPIRDEDIEQFLHAKRIQSGLTNLRTAYDFLGFRRGEHTPRDWLEDLTEEERQIFIRYFEEKQGYTEIARQLNIDPEDVKKGFRSSLHKVMKKAGRE